MSAQILKAKEFALKYHKNMYGSYPYSFHLNQVYNCLKYFGITDPVILAVAWLHDSLEDTELMYEDIFENFGKEIADLTYLLTDKRGKNRRERQEKTYPLIAEDQRGRILKIGDRICNMTQSQHEQEKQWLMYEKEYKFFKETLFKEELPNGGLGLDLIEMKMRSYLDTLVSQGHLADE